MKDKGGNLSNREIKSVSLTILYFFPSKDTRLQIRAIVMILDEDEMIFEKEKLYLPLPRGGELISEALEKIAEKLRKIAEKLRKIAKN
jgi:hypothetical protein